MNNRNKKRAKAKKQVKGKRDWRRYNAWRRKDTRLMIHNLREQVHRLPSPFRRPTTP